MEIRFKILLTIIYAVLSITPARLFAGFWGFDETRTQQKGKIWQVAVDDFSNETYQSQVEKLMDAFERGTGKALIPLNKKKAAIKVYTNSGKGLATPKGLTRAVIDALIERGFSKEQLIIIDQSESRLRESGYIAPLSDRATEHKFYGVTVLSVDSNKLKSEEWFYENPLPVQFRSLAGRELLNVGQEVDIEKTRKSYLASNLITEVDFFVNLPVIAHHDATGLNGAVNNPTLWCMSNNERFFLSPSNAPVAASEVAAIPEYLSNWAFNIVSLEHYQFIGGPSFNSLYSRSKKEILISADPVAIDSYCFSILNKDRQEAGFEKWGEPLPILNYSDLLDIGVWHESEIKLKKL